MKYNKDNIKDHWLVRDNPALQVKISHLLAKNNQNIDDFLVEHELENLLNIKQFEGLKWAKTNHFLHLFDEIRVNTNSENLDYLSEISNDIYDFLKSEEIEFENTGDNKLENNYDTVIYNVNYIPSEDEE
ncbi:Uncharacterised protein [Mycoplasmopsis californica]|uniref:Uncharacterized protein n=1 Tax=Mycoplasmopsis equigenitalium TaxID=114883 RepID=A0ABY5J345_9BACT|nr:hypothetical protein [Mycoplasmopsis equigenitalium]UUD37203.1 hypothetical protein NPA09_01355 [Mycoplasmopsis equigenitalium]VEU69493.1 Uncharacterised protein [Mycoplasmopsis californica]